MIPKISIIVPVYNVEKYLDRCIESVLNQTFKEFELILVNDGSTDSSGDICEKYKYIDKRITVIHKENGGLSSARNSGIDIAKGDYISFVDSDDFIDINMLKELLISIESNDADISVCRYKIFTQENDVENTHKSDVINIFSNKTALENYLGDFHDKKEIQTVVWDKLYKRYLFNEIRFPEGKLYEDGYVTYKLLYYSNKIVHIDKELYFYYRRKGSLSFTPFSIKTLTAYDDWKEIFNFFYDKLPSLNRKTSEKYVNKHLELYRQIHNSNDKSMNFYKNLIINDLKRDFYKLMKIKFNYRIKFNLIQFYISTLINKNT